METQQNSGLRLLRLPQVETKIGLKRSRIYSLMKEGRFPKPFRLGPRSVAWRTDDLDEWINQLPRSE
jgi:prophage regulatory protein